MIDSLKKYLGQFLLEIIQDLINKEYVYLEWERGYEDYPVIKLDELCIQNYFSSGDFYDDN